VALESVMEVCPSRPKGRGLFIRAVSVEPQQRPTGGSNPPASARKRGAPILLPERHVELSAEPQQNQLCDGVGHDRKRGG
jgi:hypothetical protein